MRHRKENAMDPDSNVSAEVPDWSREKVQRVWDPGRKLLRSIRRYQAAKARGGLLGRFSARYWVAVHWFWSLMTQSEIHLNCEIGGGLRLTHPTGIIIHPGSRIGVNCMIFHQVTLAGPVVLGGHVDVGAGASLSGRSALAITPASVPMRWSPATCLQVPRWRHSSQGDRELKLLAPPAASPDPRSCAACGVAGGASLRSAFDSTTCSI